MDSNRSQMLAEWKFNNKLAEWKCDLKYQSSVNICRLENQNLILTNWPTENLVKKWSWISSGSPAPPLFSNGTPWQLAGECFNATWVKAPQNFNFAITSKKMISHSPRQIFILEAPPQNWNLTGPYSKLKSHRHLLQIPSLCRLIFLLSPFQICWKGSFIVVFLGSTVALPKCCYFNCLFLVFLLLNLFICLWYFKFSFND